MVLRDDAEEFHREFQEVNGGWLFVGAEYPGLVVINDVADEAGAESRCKQRSVKGIQEQK